MWDYYTTRAAVVVGTYSSSYSVTATRSSESIASVRTVVGTSTRTSTNSYRELVTGTTQRTDYLTAINGLPSVSTNGASFFIQRFVVYAPSQVAGVTQRTSTAHNGFSNQVSSLATISTRTEFFVVGTNSAGATIGRSFVSLSTVSISTTFTTTGGTTSSSTNSSTFSTALTTFAQTTLSIATASRRIPLSTVDTITATITSTATASLTHTTPTAVGTTTVATTATYAGTTSVTSTVTSEVTTVTYSVFTITNLAVDRVLVPATSEWAWLPTTSDSSPISTVNGYVTDVAASFAAATITRQDSLVTRVPTATVTRTGQTFQSISQGTSTVQSTANNLTTITVTYPFTSTATATVTTTTSSTYAIQSNTALGFASSASVQFTTTRTVTYGATYEESYTDDGYVSGSKTDSFTAITTNATGTQATTVTYTYAVMDEPGEVASLNASLVTEQRITISSTSRTEFRTIAQGEVVEDLGNHGWTTYLPYPAWTVVNDPLPVFARATHGLGYQANTALGAGQPHGTALSVAAGVGWAFGFRTDMGAASFTSTYTTTTGTDTSDTAVVLTWTTDSNAVAGSLPTSLRNFEQLSRFGGYGWQPLDSSVLTAIEGKHRATIIDGTNLTTTVLDWTAASTFSLAAGRAAILERIPRMRLDVPGESTGTPYVLFPAFDGN